MKALKKWLIYLPNGILTLAILLHLFFPSSQQVTGKRIYLGLLTLLWIIFAGFIISALFSEKTRSFLEGKAPFTSFLFCLLILWDMVTLKLFLLPLPYFPPPDKVFNVFLQDWSTLSISLFHSLMLLIIGYSIGVGTGLVSGILIGWSKKWRYWMMPFVRAIGPVPAVTWIPVVMVVAPTSFTGSIFIVALSVWFPVTQMTFSGITSVQNSYFEVARTLGADQRYLIFNVAIPAAYPSIFIGLWQGMSNSFTSLIVAEMMGVKAGLGWYITWATSWAEYSKVYATLIVISLLFTSLLKMLFKLRDRVLIWQKGLIKW